MNLKLVSRNESAGNPKHVLQFADVGAPNAPMGMAGGSNHLTLNLAPADSVKYVVGATYALSLTPVTTP